MTFADRKKAADEFEDALMAKLTAIGWPAFPFGQRQLSEECRERLKRFEDGSRRPALIRWMPDIITFRDTDHWRSYVALIDAKKSGETENYAIEMSAIEVAGVYCDMLYTPTFFVFDDWAVLTPREARQRGRPGPEPRYGNGSGTPYLLVPKRYARPFSDVFPPSKQKQRDQVA